jgi:hypothetical protein
VTGVEAAANLPHIRAFERKGTDAWERGMLVETA